MAEAFTGSEKAITALRGLYSGYFIRQLNISGRLSVISWKYS